MDQLTRNMNGFPWGGFSAIMATALLFTALPLLTQIKTEKTGPDGPQSVFIDIHKPPPPPPENRDHQEQPEMVKKVFPKKTNRPQRVKPKFKIPNGINHSASNGIEIATVSQQEIKIPTGPIPYDPDEVDQPPRYLRTVPAQYPLLAKRDGIEGRVLLRFVVDLDGMAREAEVVKAEPAGFFEDAALKAIKRYKFRPAVKDGKAVICNAALAITFEMN